MLNVTFSFFLDEHLYDSKQTDVFPEHTHFLGHSCGFVDNWRTNGLVFWEGRALRIR